MEVDIKNMLTYFILSDTIYSRFKGKSRTHLPTKAKPTLTPADAQIIHSLGTSVTETSKLKKSCSKTSKNSGDCQKRQKFLLKDCLRSTIVKRQKLYGDLRSSVTLDKGFGKLNNNISEEQKQILKMEFYDEDENLSPQIYTRVQKWISQHDFKVDEMKKDPEGETVSRCIDKQSKIRYKYTVIIK